MEVAFQALQDKFRVMEQLVATQRDQLLHLQRDRDSDPVPDRKNVNSGKKKKRRKVASKELKKMRSKFTQAFMAKVDARYLAPRKSYKMYGDGVRGETINGTKFIKIVGPILKTLEASLSNDESQVVKQVCLLFAIIIVYHYNNAFANFLFTNFL